MNVFSHLSPNMADYLMLDAEVVSNVYGNLMDEMMVTIVQGHAQRLGMKTIAGLQPAHHDGYAFRHRH